MLLQLLQLLLVLLQLLLVLLLLLQLLLVFLLLLQLLQLLRVLLHLLREGDHQSDHQSPPYPAHLNWTFPRDGLHCKILFLNLQIHRTSTLLHPGTIHQKSDQERNLLEAKWEFDIWGQLSNVEYV